MSLVKSILFVLFSSSLWLASAQNIDSVEYFFDADPGFGDATRIYTGTPAPTINLEETLTASGLSLGFHVLHMRALIDEQVLMTLDSTKSTADGDGIDTAYFSYDTLKAWGSYQTRLVYVDPGGSIVSNIDAIEYFFNDDPGYGAATRIDLTDGLNVMDNIQFTASSLPLGFHVLFVRSQSVDGEWGPAESTLVYVDQSGALTINVDAVEYFFDEDPGYGNGTRIEVTSANLIQFDSLLTSSNLSLGFHTLFMRAQAESDGDWGSAQSRLVYVDPSGSLIIDVDLIEYFFDEDPGYGNGIQISPDAPSNLISVVGSLVSDTLATGFHTLHVRGRSTSGEWGSAQSSLVYVDITGPGVTPITQLEYFFDIDPGYGSATTIPVTPSMENPIVTIALAAGALGEGNHVVGVRAQDADGRWSVYESAPFAAYGPGRELDSASLAYIYKQLDGDNWTNNTNWLAGALDTWYGVDVVNTRVDSVQLSNNNLSGELPREAGYILNMKKLDLSGNNLIDTISAQLADLSLLEELILYDNQIDELADLSSITSLNTIHLDSNLLDFGDLEPYVGAANYTYSNQKVYNDFPVDSTAKINAPMTIDKTIKGANNIFQWYLNDEPVSGADIEDYILTPYLPIDSGNYVLRVTNSVVPGLELVTEPYHLGISDFEEDSLAMVSLYNSTNGTSWTDNTNWLGGDLATWNGITIQNQRVTDLSLPNNNLDGSVPWDFGYADSLVNVDLSNNLLVDTLPDSWEQFHALVTADFSENDLTSIPNLKLLTPPAHNLTTLDVTGNKLQFGDLETNLGIATFNYVPQDSISIYRDTLFDAGTESFLEFMVSGSNNSYQWYRADNENPTDESIISISTYDTLLFENPVFEDEDWYRMEATSAIITDLTLTSGYINLGISSLKRDSTALMRLYESTDGDNWALNTNWGTGNIVDWVGVTLNDLQDRVIGVSLSGNSLDGPVPPKFRDITKIENVDFSNNEISDLPNMTFMKEINSLDVSENRLGFEEIIYNLDVPGFVYDNQKKIKIEDPVRRLQFGTDDSLKVQVSGIGNQYQWTFNQFQGVSEGEISGATATNFFLDSINYMSMGTYYLTVNNPDLPDLTLQSEDFEMIAVTDVFGQIFDPDQTAYPKGDVILLEVFDGPFIHRDTSLVDGNAEYLFEDVDLGDYVLLTRPNVEEDPLYIQTYTGNSIYWEEADTLKLQEPVPGEDIIIQEDVESPPGEASISGIVETDFPDEARIDEIEARKRVKRAGCSIRRFRSAGRGEDGVWELFAYIESDENGEFEFPELPEGMYLFNVQYPGVPMNPDSDIELEVKPNSKIRLEALITEENITVNDVTLGLPLVIGGFNLYPNPTASTATIDYLVNRSIDRLGIKIYNGAGQNIFEEEIKHQPGKHRYGIDVSGWKDGIYYVVLQDGRRTMMVQMRMLVAH